MTEASTNTARSDSPAPVASVLSFDGEVDLAGGEDFSARLYEALTEGVDIVVVDMLRINFLGSAGLAALIRFQEEATRRGVEVRLVCGHAARRTIELTGLTERFNLADTLSHALPS